MAQKYNKAFGIPGSIGTDSPEPSDPRYVVELLTDLTTPEDLNDPTKLNYIYEGIFVYVLQNKGTYQWNGEDRTDINNWVDQTTKNKNDITAVMGSSGQLSFPTVGFATAYYNATSIDPKPDNNTLVYITGEEAYYKWMDYEPTRVQFVRSVALDLTPTTASTNGLQSGGAKTYIDQADALKVNISDVKDNLTSENTNKPLSAKQGKVLDEKIADKVDASLVNTTEKPTIGSSNLITSGQIAEYTEALNNTKNLQLKGTNNIYNVGNFLKADNTLGGYGNAKGVTEYYLAKEGDKFYYTGRYGDADGNSSVAYCFVDFSGNVIEFLGNSGSFIDADKLEVIAPADSIVRFSSYRSVNLVVTADVNVNSDIASKADATATQNALDLKANQEDVDDEILDLNNLVYQKAEKTNVLEKDNTTAYTPTADYHPATVKHVDDKIDNLLNGETSTELVVLTNTSTVVNNGIADDGDIVGLNPAFFVHVFDISEGDNLLIKSDLLSTSAQVKNYAFYDGTPNAANYISGSETSAGNTAVSFEGDVVVPANATKLAVGGSTDLEPEVSKYVTGDGSGLLADIETAKQEAITESKNYVDNELEGFTGGDSSTSKSEDAVITNQFQKSKFSAFSSDLTANDGWVVTGNAGNVFTTDTEKLAFTTRLADATFTQRVPIVDENQKYDFSINIYQPTTNNTAPVIRLFIKTSGSSRVELQSKIMDRTIQLNKIFWSGNVLDHELPDGETYEYFEVEIQLREEGQYFTFPIFNLQREDYLTKRINDVKELPNFNQEKIWNIGAHQIEHNIFSIVDQDSSVPASPDFNRTGHLPITVTKPEPWTEKVQDTQFGEGFRWNWSPTNNFNRKFLTIDISTKKAYFEFAIKHREDKGAAEWLMITDASGNQTEVYVNGTLKRYLPVVGTDNNAFDYSTEYLPKERVVIFKIWNKAELSARTTLTLEMGAFGYPLDFTLFGFKATTRNFRSTDELYSKPLLNNSNYIGKTGMIWGDSQSIPSIRQALVEELGCAVRDNSSGGFRMAIPTSQDRLDAIRNNDNETARWLYYWPRREYVLNLVANGIVPAFHLFQVSYNDADGAMLVNGTDESEITVAKMDLVDYNYPVMGDDAATVATKLARFNALTLDEAKTIFGYEQVMGSLIRQMLKLYKETQLYFCTLPYSPGVLAGSPGVSETNPDISRTLTQATSDEMERRMRKVAAFFGIPVIESKTLAGYYYGNMVNYTTDSIHYDEIIGYRLGQIYARELLRTKNIPSDYFDDRRY